MRPRVLRNNETAPSRNDKYQYHVGSALTPQTISGILRQADLGYMDRWADLLDEVRMSDPHLHGDLFKREHAVSGSAFEIRPNGTSRNAKKAAEYGDEIVRSIEVPAGTMAVSFRGACTHLLGGNYHGRAACEVVWSREGRWLRPSRIDWIHPRRLAWAALNWKLCLWDATSGDTPFSTFPGIPTDDPLWFPRGKLLLHTPRMYGAYPTREGLGRCLVWYAAFKRWGMRDWLAFAEWAGRGLRIGKYASGSVPAKNGQTQGRAVPEDVQALEDALVAMSSTVPAIIADSTDIDIRQLGTSNDVHEKLVLACNNEISKAILGGTLTSDPGEKGARALGIVHDDVRLMIATADAEALADTIRRDLLGPAVEERFGRGTPVPFVVFSTEPRESMDALVGRLDKMAGRGLTIPQAWVRDQLGIPDPKKGEDVIGAAKANPATPGAAADAPADPDAADEGN